MDVETYHGRTAGGGSIQPLTHYCGGGMPPPVHVFLWSTDPIFLGMF